MNDAKDTFERDSFWLKALLTDNLSLIGWLALVAFIGHRSFGWPDFGITPAGWFAIAIVSVALIGAGTLLIGRRADRRIRRGLQECGFSDAEIQGLESESPGAGF